MKKPENTASAFTIGQSGLHDNSPQMDIYHIDRQDARLLLQYLQRFQQDCYFPPDVPRFSFLMAPTPVPGIHVHGCLDQGYFRTVDHLGIPEE